MAAGDVFAFLARKGGVVDDKVHGNCRLRNLLERNRLRIVGGAEGVADVDVRDTGNGDDGTDARLLHFDLIQAVIFVEFADFDFL